MINLSIKNVTIACIDDVNTESSFELLSDISELISFGDLVLISSKPQFSQTRNMVKIRNLEEYNKFILFDLHKYIKTEFCMIVQTDGYPINLEAWRNEFLNYDYIGAPWSNGLVGNGGFSIRSKRLMGLVAENVNYDEALKKHNSNGQIFDFAPEDVVICNFYREQMESFGIKYAPLDLASSFSVENKSYSGQFGFHGKETFKKNFKNAKAYF